MTEAIGLGARPAGRLGPVTLIREGITRVAEAPVTFGLVWLVAGGAYVGARFWAQSQGSVAFLNSSLYPPYLAFMTAQALGAGVAGAFVLRAAVQGQATALKIDAGFLRCAGLLAVGEGLMMAVSGLLSAAMQGRLGPPDVAVPALYAAVAAYGALAYLYSRLLLWPIGQLTGRRDLTPMRAWGLMRGAMLGWFTANLLVLLPLGVAFVSGSMVFAPQGPNMTASTIIVLLAKQFWVQSAQVMAAVIYGHRVDASARLVAMFD
jgi:hypothetical protein